MISKNRIVLTGPEAEEFRQMMLKGCDSAISVEVFIDNVKTAFTDVGFTMDVSALGLDICENPDVK